MDDSVEKRLAPLREAIDRLDAELVRLLNERARVAAAHYPAAEPECSIPRRRARETSRAVAANSGVERHS